MNRYWRKKVSRLLLPLLGILSYYMAVYNYCLLRHDPDVYQIVCGGECSLTKEDHENIQETQESEGSSMSYAFWSKTDEIEVEDPQWGRRFSVCVWKVRGDLDILFTGSVRLLEQDLQGCYLDAGTSQELFGSTDVVGNEVLCKGRRLTIRGILQEEHALLVVRPGEKETTDHITLENATASGCDGFLMRYGIVGTAIDTMFLREILQVLLLLFPLCLVIRLFRDLKGNRAEMFRWIILLFMACLLLRSIEIPETMIPDRWSNFQFWRDWWESARDNAIAYMRQEKTGKELAQLGCFFKGAACSVLSVLIWAGTYKM